MAGYDAWAISKSVDFFARCQEAAAERQVTLCIETHRSRSLSTPWATLEILKQLPSLNLTCDFSHWVVVRERLLDGCDEAVAAAAHQAHHIHARVAMPKGHRYPIRLPNMRQSSRPISAGGDNVGRRWLPGNYRALP